MDLARVASRIAAYREVSDFTPDQVWEAAQAYHEQHGRWPNRKIQGLVSELNASWDLVDKRFGNDQMGLPNVRSLSQFLRSRGADRPVRRDRSHLTDEYIIDLVKKHKERTGRYPNAYVKELIPGEDNLTWDNIDKLLERGRQDTKYTSLADLRDKNAFYEDEFIPGVYKGYENDDYYAHINEEYLVGLLETFFADHGYYPSMTEHLPVPGEPHLSWRNIERMLQKGRREFPEGGSLSKFKQQHGLLENKPIVPYSERIDRSYVDEEYIVKLLKQHKAEHGRYPSSTTLKPIPGERGLTWPNINKMLDLGNHGLSGGDSLAKLKARRGFFNTTQAPEDVAPVEPESPNETPNKDRRRNPSERPRRTDSDFTDDAVWEAVEKYVEIHGEYPTKDSTAEVPGHPGLSWATIDRRYMYGFIGLSPKIKSLSKLLALRGVEVFNPEDRSDITEEKLKRWIEQYNTEHGEYPNVASEEKVPGENDLSWRTVNQMLNRGYHGFPQGGSLSKFKSDHGYTEARGGRGADKRYPFLDDQMIFDAAVKYKEATGKWPTQNSKDPVPGYEGLTWNVVSAFIAAHRKGISPEFNTLAQLLRSKGADIRERVDRSYLTEEYIVGLIQKYKRENGFYPQSSTESEIPGERGLKWKNVHEILVRGLLGFPRGGSLAQFKRKHGLV